MKKLLAFFMLLLCFLTAFSPTALAATMENDVKDQPKLTYNVEKVMAYAKNNWGQFGGCAVFASRCLTKGGIEVYESNKIESFLKKLDKLSCGTLFDLAVEDADGDGAPNGLSVPRSTENETIAMKGDLILWYCIKCKVYRHVGICGEDREGYISIYAHNRPEGNHRPMQMNCVEHGKGEFMQAQSYHILRDDETIEAFTKSTEEPEIVEVEETKPEAKSKSSKKKP